MATLELRGDLGQRIAVAVHGYERSEPQANAYDANWLRCLITVELGKFRGEVEASLTTNDFSRLAAQVAQLVSGAVGTASFDTIEESLTLGIAIDHAGRATISGMLRADASRRTSLSFDFESDVSFVRQLQIQLALVVSEFPARDA